MTGVANNKLLVKNTILLYIRMIVVMFITFYTTKILLSILGVEDFGVYNVVCGFVSMFGFLNTSMANGVQRFYNYAIGEGDEQSVSKLFTHALLIQLIIAGVIIIVTETVGLWYLFNKMVIPQERFNAAFWVFQMSLLSLFFVVLQVPYNAAIMAYEKMDFYAILSIGDAILKLMIVLILPFFSGDKIITYGFLLVVINVLDLLANVIYCKRTFKHIRLTNGFDHVLLSKILSFSGWNIFGSFAHLGKVQGVNLVLNSFWGTVVNTAFGIAIQISNAVNSLTAGFVTALRPQMIKCYAAGNISYAMKLLYSASKMTFYLVLIIVIPLVYNIKPILDIWLGTGNYPNVTPTYCQLMMLVVLFDSFATPISIIVHASGKMRNFQIVCSLVVVSIVPLSFVMAKLGYDSNTIVAAGILVTVISQITRLVLLKQIVSYSIKEYILEVFWPACYVLLIACGGAMAINYIFGTSNIICVILSIALCFAISINVIYFFGLNKTEKLLVKSIIFKNQSGQ